MLSAIIFILYIERCIFIAFFLSKFNQWCDHDKSSLLVKSFSSILSFLFFWCRLLSCSFAKRILFSVPISSFSSVPNLSRIHIHTHIFVVHSLAHTRTYSITGDRSGPRAHFVISLSKHNKRTKRSVNILLLINNNSNKYLPKMPWNLDHVLITIRETGIRSGRGKGVYSSPKRFAART